MKRKPDVLEKRELGRRDAMKLMAAGFMAGGLVLSSPLRKAVEAAAPKVPFKIALVAFSTGPAASYGYPAHEMMDLLVPIVNSKGGILGRRVALSKYDEGSTSRVVETFTRLTQKEKVDAILGVASSANTLAAAPIAERNKTIFISCLARTHKVTWQNANDPTKYRKWVFKSVNDTITHASSAALVAAKFFPGARVAHIHPDYAYGHEMHDIFNAALKKVDPKAEIVVELWPKLFTPDYSPHISKILASKATLVYNSFWGADSTRFADQCIQRGLLSRAKLMGDHGEFYSAEKRPLPKELYGNPPLPLWGHPAHPDPKRWVVNKFEYDLFYNKYKIMPPAGASFTAAGFRSLVGAIERAAAFTETWPTNEQITKAFNKLAVAQAAGWMVFREDGKASSPKWGGLYKPQPPYAYGLEDIYHIPMEEVCAPPGVDPMKWLAEW